MLERERNNEGDEIAGPLPASTLSQDKEAESLKTTPEDLLYGHSAISYKLFSRELTERCAELVEDALETNLTSSALCSAILWEKGWRCPPGETLRFSVEKAITEIALPEPQRDELLLLLSETILQALFVQLQALDTQEGPVVEGLELGTIVLDVTVARGGEALPYDFRKNLSPQSTQILHHHIFSDEQRLAIEKREICDSTFSVTLYGEGTRYYQCPNSWQEVYANYPLGHPSQMMSAATVGRAFRRAIAFESNMFSYRRNAPAGIGLFIPPSVAHRAPCTALDHAMYYPYLFEVDIHSLSDQELVAGLVGVGDAAPLFFPAKPRVHFSTQCIFTSRS